MIKLLKSYQVPKISVKQVWFSVSFKKVSSLLVHCCTKCKCIFSCVYLVAVSKYIWIISLHFICFCNIKINVQGRADRCQFINFVSKLHLGEEENVMLIKSFLAMALLRESLQFTISYIWLQWLQAATDFKQFDIILQLLQNYKSSE